MSRGPRDVHGAVRCMEGVLRDLIACHRRGEFHGGVCPDAVRHGRWRSRLDPPGRAEAPVEYRDPERVRARLKDPREDGRAAARSDVYGAGALLHEWLEGGPPLCGPASPFTRPVAPAAAWIASRAMAEGGARYPSAREMLRDVERLLRLSRRRRIDSVTPRELPSYSGGPAAVPPRLRPFGVRRRRSRIGTLVAAACLAVGVIVLLLRTGPEASEARPAGEAVASSETGLRGLVSSWRSRLDGSLRASGEELDPAKVPLVVVSEVGDPGDLGWPRRGSPALSGALRNTLRDGAEADEIQRVLDRLVGDSTHPAVLWLGSSEAKDTVEARLCYRGVSLSGSAEHPRGVPR